MKRARNGTNKDNRFHIGNIYFPFSQPLGSIGGTRDGGTDFYVEVATFVNFNCGNLQHIRMT